MGHPQNMGPGMPPNQGGMPPRFNNQGQWNGPRPNGPMRGMNMGPNGPPQRPQMVRLGKFRPETPKLRSLIYSQFQGGPPRGPWPPRGPMQGPPQFAHQGPMQGPPGQMQGMPPRMGGKNFQSISKTKK